MAALLEIEDLHVEAEGTEILRGIDLTVDRGDLHALMGPNGSGKSTLAKVLMGDPDFQVTSGVVRYDGEDLLDLPVEERARRGIFLSFQYPVEVPGVPQETFLRTAVNRVRAARGESELSEPEFREAAHERLDDFGLPRDLLDRGINEDFSGGERKRNEVFQMALLDPTLCILDETDSGLDIDALKTVAEQVNGMRRDDRGILLITHYERILEHVPPDHVHVIVDGRIVQSGGMELARELEEKGYAWVREELAG